MTPIYRFGWTFSRLASRLYFRSRIEGLEHLPASGPTLICANHVSYLDPPLIGSAWPRGLTFLARATLFRGFGAWLYPRLNCVPVDQERPDVAALKVCVRELKAGKEMIMFPEGARSFDGSLQPGQPGVGLIVAKARPLVVPAHIQGAHEAYPRGAALPKPKKVVIRFGPPLDYRRRELGSGKESYQQIADEIMAAIATLGGVPAPDSPPASLAEPSCPAPAGPFPSAATPS